MMRFRTDTRAGSRTVRRSSLRLTRGVLPIAIVIVSLSCGGGGSSGSVRESVEISGGGTCLYTGHRIDLFDEFGTAIGRPLSCAVVFNNAAPNWSDLVEPWFLTHRDPNLNWAAWKRADPGRQLIISQALVPDAAPSDWRARGAAGDHDVHARTLATNLVENGLGDSVIRLAHESNLPQSADGVGPDSSQYEAWSETWKRFAVAMSGVPGAEFEFDWTVNPGFRPISFDDYYPGDAVVDIIGVDIYDFWDVDRLGPAPNDVETRWNVRYDEPAGVGELIAFAQSRGKPLSIPEWGLSSPGFQGGLGDNPAFVEEMLRLIREHDVSYQAYFAKSPDTLVIDSPRSFTAYQEAFGGADRRAGAEPKDQSNAPVGARSIGGHSP